MFQPWQVPSYGGLLSQEDQTYARNQGLLGLASGLLASSGPSRTPVGLGQAFGQGLMGMQQQQNLAAQTAIQNKTVQAQLEAADREKQREAQLAGLIGAAPSIEQMGPPTAEGQYSANINTGSGLLGGEFDKEGLYARMAGLGGQYTKAGLNGLESLNPASKDSPSSVREWEFFNKLPKAEQALYLEMKRNLPIMNLGGTQAVRAPGGGIGEQYQVTLKPGEQPGVRADQSYGGQVGKDTGEADVKQHDLALAAVDNIGKLDTILNHLNSSDAITGMGAETLKNIERMKVFVSDSEKSGRKVADSELLDALLGSDVFPMIGALGIGARGMDTPAEREFLRSVMTGTTPMNKQTLIRMTEMRKNIAQRAIDKFNKRVDSGELDRYFKMTGRQKEKIKADRITTGPIGGFKVLGRE